MSVEVNEFTYLAVQFIKRIRGKGNIVPVHDMDACRISGVTLPILNLDPSD
jgi:hypothetical protein